MDDVLEFAEVAGSIIAAIGLAMGLEWLSLHGLLRLMPRQVNEVDAITDHSAARTTPNATSAALTMFPGGSLKR